MINQGFIHIHHKVHCYGNYGVKYGKRRNEFGLTDQLYVSDAIQHFCLTGQLWSDTHLCSSHLAFMQCFRQVCQSSSSGQTIQTKQGQTPTERRLSWTHRLTETPVQHQRHQQHPFRTWESNQWSWRMKTDWEMRGEITETHEMKSRQCMSVTSIWTLL